jgi:hypothetical protein
MGTKGIRILLWSFLAYQPGKAPTVFIFEVHKIRIELSLRYDIYEPKENAAVEK